MRPEIRAAVALEEAGELQEAARVFEYAGEHAQAALLRLEHARTLRDPSDRIDVLREGCARNPGSTPEGRTLHLALADALLSEAESVEGVARRRALELEAAASLEEADEGGRAGELFEGLGLLHKARGAYERAGEIVRLEFVLEVLERQEQRAAAGKELLRDVDDAIANGRRHYAWDVLVEHVRGGSPLAPTSALAVRQSPDGRPPSVVATAAPELVSRLQQLESRLVRQGRFELSWGPDRVTSIRLGDSVMLGRAPDADLPLPDAKVSRHHVRLHVDGAAERPRLVAVDQGSRVGSFWQGEALEPGVATPITEPGELALGAGSSLEVHPVRGPGAQITGGLVRHPGSERWLLFLPGGGPLVLAPEIRVPANVFFGRGLASIDFATRVAATLDGRALDPGAHVVLLHGDRLCLVDAPLCMEVVR